MNIYYFKKLSGLNRFRYILSLLFILNRVEPHRHIRSHRRQSLDCSARPPSLLVERGKTPKESGESNYMHRRKTNKLKMEN